MSKETLHRVIKNLQLIREMAIGGFWSKHTIAQQIDQEIRRVQHCITTLDGHTEESEPLNPEG